MFSLQPNLATPRNWRTSSPTLTRHYRACDKEAQSHLGVKPWRREGEDVWTPLEQLTLARPHTKHHPTGYSWMAQQLPSGSSMASGPASILLKLTLQCSTNSRQPGYWAARTTRRVKISLVGNLRTRILQQPWGNGLHENAERNEDMEFMLQRVTGTFVIRITNHHTKQTRLHSLIQNLSWKSI